MKKKLFTVVILLSRSNHPFWLYDDPRFNTHSDRTIGHSHSGNTRNTNHIPKSNPHSAVERFGA